MHSHKYKQPASLAVSNNQSKQAKQYLYAGWLEEVDKSVCDWAAVAP